MFSFMPWKKVDNIYELTGQWLASMDIRFLMVDLDNTLCPYNTPMPDERLLAWRDDLARSGVRLFLLSNSRKPARAAGFAQAMDIPFLGHAGKPKVAGYRKAMADNHVSPEQCAMAGDQVFTDILGANRAGIRSILVKPISLKGNPGRYLRYWAECPIRGLSAGRKINF